MVLRVLPFWAHPIHLAVEHVQVEGREEVMLVGEAEAGCDRAHLCPAADLLHGGAGEALAREDLLGRIQDLCTARSFCQARLSATPIGGTLCW